MSSSDVLATTTTCDHKHDGAHLLLWNAERGGSHLRIREIVEDAAVHAVDADPDLLATFETVIARARAAAPHGRATNLQNCVQLDDDEYRAVAHVVEEAADYMLSNGYADDNDGSHDSLIAQLLGDGAIALACWAGRF